MILPSKMSAQADAELAHHREELARQEAAAHPEPIVPIKLPVVTPKPFKNLPRSVLVAVDESEPSRRALIWALQNFNGEEVVVCLIFLRNIISFTRLQRLTFDRSRSMW